MKKVKGLSKNKLTDTNSSLVITRGKEKGVGEVEEGKEGMNDDGRKLELGWKIQNTL